MKKGDVHEYAHREVGSMTPEQCRAARGWLGWTQAELATAANVSLSTVRDFERGRRTPVSNNLIAIRSALEAMGLGFVYVNEDGQTKPCGITYAAPKPETAH